MTKRFRLLDVGQKYLRRLDGDTERHELRPCFHVVDPAGTVVAEVFEVGFGSWEMWRDGEMTELPTAQAALALIKAVPPATFTDEARERLKEKLDAIDLVRKPLLEHRKPLDEALRALDALHDAAVEEAGVELLDECCETCSRLLVIGDRGHRCGDGPVLCESCAPTWNDIRRQYDSDKQLGGFVESYETPKEAEEADRLVDQMIADGKGDEKWLLPL
jgi:hypothetical protein